jgi:uncharacterized protein YkuJ
MAALQENASNVKRKYDFIGKNAQRICKVKMRRPSY